MFDRKQSSVVSHSTPSLTLMAHPPLQKALMVLIAEPKTEFVNGQVYGFSSVDTANRDELGDLGWQKFIL